MSRGIASSRTASRAGRASSMPALWHRCSRLLPIPLAFRSWSNSCSKRPVRTRRRSAFVSRPCLQLMRTAIDAARTQGEDEVNRAFETIADLLRQTEPRHDDRDARSPAGVRIRKKPISVDCGQSDDRPGDCLVHGRAVATDRREPSAWPRHSKRSPRTHDRKKVRRRPRERRSATGRARRRTGSKRCGRASPTR